MTGSAPSALALALLLAMRPGMASPLEQPAAAGAMTTDASEAADSDATDKQATTLDAVSVKAAPGVTKNAVAAKRSAAVTVDSLDENSIQVHSQEDSIAQKLLSAPGVSVTRDEDQPRYITVRGIEPNLNSTTLDGITMASVGDEGSGERKINLQLIPNDIADRVDIYKTFSAEQNPDSVGAGINLVSGSAFDHADNTLHLDTSGNYHDLSNDNGANSLAKTKSRWGDGFSGRYSTTFGPGHEFGLTLSARRQEFQSDQNKLFQTTQYFYDTSGASISGPIASDGWNGKSAPYNIAYYADNRWIESYGGSAKLEWRPTDSPWRASLLAYDYGMEERRTENGYQFLTSKGVDDQTATSGTVDIASGNVIFGNKTWARNNRGVLGSLQWADGDQALDVRAGYTRDRVTVSTSTINLRATASDDEQLSYASSGVGEIYNVTSLSDPSFATSSTYTLSSAQQTRTDALAEVKDIRADYTKNIDADARGFGLAAGMEYKRLGVDTDYTTITYETGQDYTSYLYTPSYKYPKSSYVLPFFNYKQFLADGGWNSLTVNSTSSLYSSLASDFKYTEDVKDAYLSLHYATDRLEGVLGVRYDDTTFAAHTPDIESSTVVGTVLNKGGYHNPLPSLNLVFHATDDINVRASVSKTIGRPIPSNIAQAEVVSCDSDSGDCTITRGNPQLKPEISTNFDLSAEKYFDGNRGYVSLALFAKKIKDNIASVATESVADDGTVTTVTTPENMSDSKVHGVEFSFVQRDLEWLGQSFDLMFNATHMGGEMTYHGTNGSRTIHQLITQPNNVANLGVTWNMPWFNSSLTISENYTDRYLITIGSSSWQDRGFRARYVADLSWTTRFNQHWSMQLSAANLFGEDQYETLGDNYQYMRNLNNYGASYAAHVTYDFN